MKDSPKHIFFLSQTNALNDLPPSLLSDIILSLYLIVYFIYFNPEVCYLKVLVAVHFILYI